jgi:hypothetical protein
MCRIQDTAINPTVTAQRLMKFSMSRALNLPLCHATTLRHYALAVLTLDI